MLRLGFSASDLDYVTHESKIIQERYLKIEAEIRNIESEGIS